MLSKSLIQFSVDGQGCVPSLLFDLRPTMVEKMKIMTSFKRSCACTAALRVPNPAPGHRRPRLRQRLLDTHGQVWLSLLWGHGSFLLGPGVHKVSFVPAKSLFPQSCVSSGGSQFSSVTQLCPTLCDPMNRSTPGLPVHHKLPEFTQTHIHRVSDAIQPSHPLLSPSPPAPNPSQHQSLFQ